MTNHVHLLITPSEQDSISRIIQHLGRQYVQYINKTYRRSGTLWEGRHKGSLVDAEHYLMACYRYIEMNPVAAGMVEMPEQYCWSSYPHNAWGTVDALISPHPVYKSLSLDMTRRLTLYRKLFSTTPADADLHCIRNSLAKNLPTGNSRFSDQIAKTTGQKLGKGKRGRPKQTG